MREENGLLVDLEAFVEASINRGAWTALPATLNAKLDVLERVIELLRMRTGRVFNELKMQDLLRDGLSVERDHAGFPRLRFATGYPNKPLVRRTPDGFRQSELQAPLIRFLLVNRRGDVRPIAKLIDEFVSEMRPYLSPADVESTKTGVTRIATTTRSTAAALRLHGLITESDSTAYKTWELSLLGLLVGAVLCEGGEGAEPPARGLPFVESAVFGASNHLAAPLRGILRRFASPNEIGQAVQRVFGPNADTIESFDRIVGIVAGFCRGVDSEAHDVSPVSLVRRNAAKALTSELSGAIPPGLLARDLAVDQALRALTGPAL